MENGTDKDTGMLFPPSLLKDLKWSNAKANFKNGVCPNQPGDGLLLRPLTEDDFHKQYMTLMSQLTNIGEVTEADFKNRFDEMKKCKGTYFITVIEDLNKKEIIGSASLILEQKFIHSTGQRGRIEDVVVSDDYRGKQLGKLLVQTLTLIGQEMGCYKLSLECKEENIKFYENFGFNGDGQLFMVQRFKP